MRKKLDYSRLVRIDTHIDKDLKRPLDLVRYLRDKTLSEIVSEALREHLGAELEIIHDEIVNVGNPNNTLKTEVAKWSKFFERL